MLLVDHTPNLDSLIGAIGARFLAEEGWCLPLFSGKAEPQPNKLPPQTEAVIDLSMDRLRNGVQISTISICLSRSKLARA
jgi:hypothetical protein